SDSADVHPDGHPIVNEVECIVSGPYWTPIDCVNTEPAGDGAIT
ncbi:hypothetical protein BVRB_020300, partial [Beta vulgaris subsp. vulgaris]